MAVQDGDFQSVGFKCLPLDACFSFSQLVLSLALPLALAFALALALSLSSSLSHPLQHIFHDLLDELESEMRSKAFDRLHRFALANEVLGNCTTLSRRDTQSHYRPISSHAMHRYDLSRVHRLVTSEPGGSTPRIVHSQ